MDAIAGTHNKVTPEQSPGPVVQKLDSAIHRIIHYPLDKLFNYVSQLINELHLMIYIST